MTTSNKKTNIIKKEQLNNLIILLPYIWLVTGLFLYKDSDKGMVIMMMISVIASISHKGLKVVKENITNSKMLWIIFIITAYALFSYYYHGLSSREIRAFVALSIFLPFFPRALFTKDLLIILTIVGSVSCFSSAIYYSIIEEVNRSHWPINAIPFSTIAATFSLLAIGLLTAKKSNFQKLLLILALLLTIVSVLISQTRGVWVAFTITAIILIFLTVKENKINFNYKILLTSFILFSIIAVAFYPKIEKRLMQTQSEVKKISAGNLGSSIGLRLQMLAVTPDMVKGDLWIGTGNGQSDKLAMLYKQGKVRESLYRSHPPHYHNQYADKLIKNGLIGLILFLLLLLIPILESKHVSMANRHTIIGIVLLFSLAAMTDAPFNHGQSLFVFVLLLFALTNKENSSTKAQAIK